MTIAEFRKDPERVQALRSVLDSPVLQEAIAIIKSQPSKAAESITPHYALIRLGRLEERIIAFEDLQLMSTHHKPVDIKRTYQAPQ